MTHGTFAAGKLGKDCELRKNQDGKDIMSFSVAVSEGKDRTQWYECATSAPYLINLAQYLKKGASVAVFGKHRSNKKADKTYWTLWVDNITLQGGKVEKSETPTQSPPDYDNGGDSIPF